MKADIKGWDGQETEQWAVKAGLKPYRARQIRRWLLDKLVESPEEMTNIPKEIRALVGKELLMSPLKTVKTEQSEDGTVKFLFKLPDGPFIESVLIPERDHLTICISSQAGCAMGCRFCFTGKQGLKRNLSASEIIEQVILVKRTLDYPEQLRNIVLMGMGEPLANYEAVLRALKNLIAQDGMNFSHRKITVSTCGMVPQMKQLGLDIAVNLAVSLNASDNETRDVLMPVNRKYPLESLMAACREFPLPNRRMITFEYILIQGKNDRDQDVENLCRLLSGIRAKINLIALNSHPGSNMAPPSMERILRFQEMLAENHFTVILRKSKGSDISAACGQLSGTHLEKGLQGPEHLR